MKVEFSLSGKSAFWLLFLIVATISAVADLTKFSNLPPHFIGHADQANMAIVARNIAEGKGAVVDVIWLLTSGGIPGNVIPIPEPYWSIYVAGVISFFFLLFGANLTAMLVPAVLIKISIAALSAGMMLRLTRSTIAAITVSVPLLYHPMMTQCITGLSDIYLTFFALCSSVVFSYAISRNSVRLFFLAGLLIGIAIGVKPSGMLLLGLPVGYIIFSGQVKVASRHLIVVITGVLLGLLPLILHNYQAFDSVISPAVGLVVEANRIKLATFDHNIGFYDPDATAVGLDTLQDRLTIANFYFRNFYSHISKGALVPIYFFPFLALGIFFVVSSIRSFFIYRGSSLEQIFSYISVQILIAALVLGFAVHWEARYWNFAVPFAIILSVYSITRLTKNKVIWATACVLVTAVSLWSLAESLQRFQPKPIPKAYERVADLLPKDAIVFSNDPWQFSFHTRLRSVMLPHTYDDTALLSLSKRYGVGYIVILGEKTRHPKYQALVKGDLPDYLEPVELNPYLKILKFK